jgi:carboxyl-terminal processing protease
VSFRVFVAAALASGVMALPSREGAQAPQASETFDAAWKIVRDSLFDPTFNGTDWEKVRAELRPRAEAAKTPGELRAVLRDMLGRLGLSHFAVIPSSPDTPGAAYDLQAEPGFDVRLIGHDVVVSSVDPAGGAAAAGVRPGSIVRAIGEKPAAAFLSDLHDGSAGRVAQLAAWRAIVTRLRGPEDSKVDVTFDEPEGRTVTRSITRHAEPGNPVTVGHLPTMYVRVRAEAAKTPAGGQAGVIGFNVWMSTVDAPFQQAVERFRASDGIVIDLRGNPGGLAAMIMGIAGHFVGERVPLGVMKTRDAELRFTVNPRIVNRAGQRVDVFRGPVAILVDGLTGSASECFAGGMQSIGRARVFGQTSMGQALPALFDRLPNGDVLIHALGDFVTASGTRLEGRGVIPDEQVPLTRDDLAAGRDRTLLAALTWIDENRKSR